jgi:hypothetical protein
LAKLGVELGSPIVMVVTGAAVPLLVAPDEPADGGTLELLEPPQPAVTAEAITIPAAQTGRTSVRLICSS